jgi:hypothetical protein
MGGPATRPHARGMKTKPALAAAGAVVALALAPSAFAHDYCVANPACVGAGGTNELSVEAALAAADGGSDSDRVLIGAGTFTAPTTGGYEGGQGGPVEMIGAGPGSTTLTGPTDTVYVLRIGPLPGSRVSNLSLRIPPSAVNTTKTGLHAVSATADHLTITADPGAGTYAVGADLFTGAILQDSTVDLSGMSAPNTGVDLAGGSEAFRNSVTARTGIQLRGVISSRSATGSTRRAAPGSRFPAARSTTSQPIR